MNNHKRVSIGLLGVACAVCGIVGLSNLSFKSAQNSAYADTEDVEITSNTACDFGVQNKDCVILQTEQAHFAKNDLITVDYQVYSEYGITDFDYEVDGIEVDNINIENLSVTVKFNMLSGVENATLNLNLKLLSENTVSATLHCVQNEYGVFISRASIDDAYEKYYTFAKANGFMTEEECRQCRNEYVRAKIAEINGEYAVENREETENYNAPIKVSRAKSKDTYVSGHLQWKDDDGNNHPLRGVKVEVYDEDTNTDDYVGTTYTDDNGYYFLTFQNKDGAFDFENKGLDLYIRVFAEDSGNLKVTRNDGSSYSFDSTV